MEEWSLRLLQSQVPAAGREEAGPMALKSRSRLCDQLFALVCGYRSQLRQKVTASSEFKGTRLFHF